VRNFEARNSTQRFVVRKVSCIVTKVSRTEFRSFLTSKARAAGRSPEGEEKMSLGTILLIILILLLIGALPTWPHSTSWGYYPSGGLGLVLVIVLILLLLGRI
jgi:hypothetical protein